MEFNVYNVVLSRLECIHFDQPYAGDCISDADIERMRMAKSSETNQTDPIAERDGDDATANPTRAAWI
ncbi:MAG: hypothetical protein JWQ17_3006, partial [Tardiphaga sp.]|nr:hypothetical protein [Tardiphaga sp.]